MRQAHFSPAKSIPQLAHGYHEMTAYKIQRRMGFDSFGDIHHNAVCVRKNTTIFFNISFLFLFKAVLDPLANAFFQNQILIFDLFDLHTCFFGQRNLF